MPTTNAYGPLFREWDSLDSACEQNADALPGIESVREPLAALRARAEELKDRQENLDGERRQVTQELRTLVEEAKEAARRLRGFVKARLGTKSNRLRQFGIAPIVKRSRREGTPDKV